MASLTAALEAKEENLNRADVALKSSSEKVSGLKVNLAKVQRHEAELRKDWESEK